MGTEMAQPKKEQFLGGAAQQRLGRNIKAALVFMTKFSPPNLYPLYIIWGKLPPSL